MDFFPKNAKLWVSSLHISATSASRYSIILVSSLNNKFCLIFLFSFLSFKICTFKFPTYLYKVAFLFNFDSVLERATQAFSLAGFHSLKCFMDLSSDILFSSLILTILYWASLHCLFIHLMFFYPSVGEVGGLSLASSWGSCQRNCRHGQNYGLRVFHDLLPLWNFLHGFCLLLWFLFFRTSLI